MLNQRAFDRVQPLLAPRAVIAIHDAGAFPLALIPTAAPEDDPGRWAGDEYEHQPDERAFVNWLLSTHPQFAQIHLHSRRALRHGLTLLQHAGPLERPVGVFS